MAGTFTRPTASEDGTHKHNSPEKAEYVSEFEVVVGRTRTATATTTHRELDEEATESTPSNAQQNILQPDRLPPNSAKGAKERVRRPAAEILEKYKECNLEQQKYCLRFCKEQIDCCRLMVERSARFSSFVKDPKGDVALFNRYTTRLGVQEEIKIPDGAEKTIEKAERALAILSDMQNLKHISLTDMVFIHDLYESLEGGFHVSGDTHWRKCKFYI